MIGAYFTRRRFITRAAGTAVGGSLATAGYLVGRDQSSGFEGDRVPFDGAHQAGITTPMQNHLQFAAFDLTRESKRADLKRLLADLTHASRLMCARLPLGGGAGAELAPPDDTGEADGLQAARLTITFGFGPTLFDNRFGLSSQRPAALADIPAFPGDGLDPARGGGDFAVQVCSDDPQLAFYAARNLTRIARGTASLRWNQSGFVSVPNTEAPSTPRNLHGFKDGTNNLKADDAAAMGRHVWVGVGDGPAWMTGGSYLVARRIRMLIEVWDRSSLADQEDTIGRHKQSGAPIGEQRESAAVDPTRLKPDAHIRLASQKSNGAFLLRRGYSFSDGMDEERGQLDAGLFFLAYQRDPRRQFVRIQRRLAGSDALNEYIQHTASALFACPPGAQPGRHIGHTLLDGA